MTLLQPAITLLMRSFQILVTFSPPSVPNLSPPLCPGLGYTVPSCLDSSRFWPGSLTFQLPRYISAKAHIVGFRSDTTSLPPVPVEEDSNITWETSRPTQSALP